MSSAPLSHAFWSGRRIFITGHTGFKGSWLMVMLSRLGATVTGYSLPPHPGPGIFKAANVAAFGASVFGDIRDEERLLSAMAEAKPDIVLHLAAQALVRPARAAPIETLSTNIVGTAQVLEAVRKTKSVVASVVITSDKVYDNVEWAWAYREADRLGGKEPYGASKACAEIVVEAYRSSYFSGEDGHSALLATARAGNVIGGGDWAEDRLVPDAIRSFQAGERLMLRNPASVRPWQHVLEPLSGYLRLAEALVTEGTSLPLPHTFNFGPAAEDAVPVSVVTQAIATLWGNGAEWSYENRRLPYEARLLEVDSARAKSVLGWRPRWRLDRAIEHTVGWYKAHWSGDNMQALTLKQIDEYLYA